MKTRFLTLTAILMLLSILLGALTIAETYPVYEIIARPALIRSKPALSNGSLESDTSIITSAPLRSLVLVAEETNGWCLVYTRDQQIGYIQREYIQPTGDTYTVDFVISSDAIPGKAAVIEYISIDPLAIVPEESEYQQAYAATLKRGQIVYDCEHLLDTLLGPGYEKMERDTYSSSTQYESRSEDKPYRYVYIDDETRSFRYYDSMVASERYGEYEPPNLNMMPDESLVFLKALLSDVLPARFLEYPGVQRRIEEKRIYHGRWMTDSEYADYMKGMDVHYFTFEHYADNGVWIADDDIMAVAGVNGLASLEINWHDFSAIGDARITPISLDEAIRRANSTRLADAVLLYARLSYSNWLTENDEFNLSWYLVTDAGNYVVDCVLGTHRCDHYEY